MKTLNSFSLLTLMVVMTIGFSASVQAMKAPDQVVRETVDSIVKNIQSNRETYKANTNALYAMVENTLVPAIHVPRMANLILGKATSKKSTAAQKAAFAAEFKTFLLRSYATALLEYTGSEKVVYEPISMAPGSDKVTVRAALIASSGSSYPVNLYMSNRKDSQWRAYNLEVAGINFVSTYRATFGEIIAQRGIDGLIADLRQKNAR
ncbi:MAG: phospholipid transport system substrate-binding protein [Cryomorphaceae bacterium]|jgi:phospholipid transport system substrate-binding protein